MSLVEGIVLDFNLHFRVMFGEFVQTYEGTSNTMVPRTVDAIALGPSGNLQGGVHCFSLLTGRVLDRQWKDVEVHKMLQSAINRINFMVKKQKAIKGLKFGDRQNLINAAISTGVMDDQDMAEDLINSNFNHDIIVDNDPNNVEDDHPDMDNNADSDVVMIDDNEHPNSDQNDEDIEQNNDETTVDDSVDNSDEEHQPESIEAEEGLYQTRSGRRSRPVDMSKRFLES